MRNDFAVFIITHGRPEKQLTLKTLKQGGYTGKVFFILDDEDPTIEEYKQLYGEENIKIFHKDASLIDLGDNQTGVKGVPSYARNACWSIAEGLGLDCFCQLDDDFTSFNVRYNKDGKFASKKVKNIDLFFLTMIEWLNCSPNIYCVAMGVQGDYIGGLKAVTKKGWIAQSSRGNFFCSIKKRFNFVGRINEDITTAAYHNMMARLFYTTLRVHFSVLENQKNTGGSTEMYKGVSYYWVLFYSVLWCPSAIKLVLKKNEFTRHVSWGNLLVKVIDEKHKKQ